jgi:hypothetical protein
MHGTTNPTFSGLSSLNFLRIPVPGSCHQVDLDKTRVIEIYQTITLVNQCDLKQYLTLITVDFPRFLGYHN